MGETILVPYDDSPQSVDALRHTLQKHPDDDILLLHVIDLMDAGFSTPIDGTLPGFWEEWYESQQESSERLFEDAQAIADEYDVTLATETVVGRPARTINDYAEENEIDHIIMGSHGRTGVSRVLLGSVAEAVVRRAPCPVTIVR
ncbi:universal stress protein [Haloarchaeobius amylolyticus]|uniref:universal stress protein n=1 Tax=Haloarchaeobius amylolyticus TaxID=1198296 RepID=UPI002271FB86|nr:universal stress protein [Haloarchaeobius amylolyticus]